MSKVYKFIDLLSEIELEKIEENTKFKIFDDNNLFRPQIATYKNRELKIGEENIFNCYYLDYLLHADFKLIEDEVDIETINAYNLIEAPYMAQCLRGNQFDRFTDLLKQSELEIVEKINKLVDKVKQQDKEIKSIKEKQEYGN